MKKIGFKNYPVMAGFTQKPEDAALVRETLGDQAAREGGVAIWPYLVHGTRIALVERGEGRGEVALASNEEDYKDEDFEMRSKHVLGVEATDGCITASKDVVLTSSHGDCLPIFAYDTGHNACGLVHAGWRGTLSGIAEELVWCMQEAFETDPSELMIYIGPGIGFSAFEVEEDVARAFLDEFDFAEGFMAVKPAPEDGSAQKYLIDLAAINDELLKLSGVPEDNIKIDPDCTYTMADKYWSHRRGRDKERMLAFIRLV